MTLPVKRRRGSRRTLSSRLTCTSSSLRIDKISVELASIQERYYKANQESTDARLKAQTLENSVNRRFIQFTELKREVVGLKVYLNEVEEATYSRAAGGSWQEQREKENLAGFVQKVKKVMRTAEHTSGAAYVGESNPPDSFRGVRGS